MRGWPILVLLLAPIVAAGAPDDATTRSYVGSTTRELVTGPLVVCDREGNGIGGACFDAPFVRGSVTIIVHDAHLPALVPIPVMMYAYGADVAPLPTDSSVSCAPNHSAMTFWFERYTTRIVVAVGPWVLGGGVSWPGPTCAGAPGTTGTIDMLPLYGY